jgi:hypothetical protein
VGSLALLGAGFACQPIDVDEGSQPGQLDGCGEVSEGGRAVLQFKSGTDPTWGDWSGASPWSDIKQISNTTFGYDGMSGKWGAVADCVTTAGATVTATYRDSSKVACENARWKLRVIEGTCANNSDDLPPLPPSAKEPIPYTDPVTNCTYNVQLLDFVEQVPGGTQDPVYLISGSDTARADGGVVGGCNFAPTVYYGGSGGGGGFGGGDGAPPFPYVPGSDDDGRPNWLNTLAGALAGAAGAIAADAVADAIQDAFATKYPGLIYRMVSVCEKNASGEPISEAVEVPIPDLRAPDAQLARLDAIVELLQASKNFKQPVCPNERPKLEGDWRTISFRSTQSSPYGKSCLRKRFRYRSVSGIGLGELVDHWKDFTWTTGPVIVTHTGHTWGSLKVWAATADEGKRVIQHAAREAGFDADQVGEWGISNSSGSRYGVSLPVKVDTTGGYYWITNRDGSNQRPIVALTSDI